MFREEGKVSRWDRISCREINTPRIGKTKKAGTRCAGWFSLSQRDAVRANGVNENRPAIQDRWLDYCNPGPRKRQCKCDVYAGR